MRRISAIFLMLSLLASAPSCASKRAESVEFFAMDTVMNITAYGKDAVLAIDEAKGRIEYLEDVLSVTDPGSLVYAHNNTGISVLHNTDIKEIIPVADELYEMTDGAFDVYIYPVVEAWGFFSGDYRIPGEDELKELLSDRSKLDFGGIAKGYASDSAAEIAREHGVKSALIALGGNIYAVGNNINGKPWRIAVQDPFDMSGYAGILSISDAAAVTSGAYQRYFELDGVWYHHIIDPRTGYPADSGLVSVTVVSKDGTLADGLSTGLFVLGKERALKIWGENREKFDLVLIEDDGTITITAGLDGRFESENSFEVAR